MLPQPYRWLAGEAGPRMIVEALAEFGVLEAPGAANNPRILAWQRELQAAGFGRDYGGSYDADAIPWCGLFLGLVALRANRERRPERDPPRRYLAARAWVAFGHPVATAALGDVLVFKRQGGGHVGLYVGHDARAFHVLGGNQTDKVMISRIARQRLIAARRPACRAEPANVRPILLHASGGLSVNEA